MEASRAVAQIFPPYSDTIFRLVLVLMVAVPTAAMAIGYSVLRSDYVSGVGWVRGQPIPFSHKHHVGGLGLDCRYCHASVERAAVAGMPSTRTCMTCHSQLWTEADMLAPLRASLAQGEPIRWRRVHDLPDFVFFNHSIHLAKGIGCQSCHGRVAEMPLTRKAEPLTMGWCLDCHRNPERHVRPRRELFDTTWTPPPNRGAWGRALADRYGIRPTAEITHCYVCHR